MKMLNVCVDDWANFSHNIANSLRSVGVYCDDVKLNPHINNYSSQSKVITRQHLSEIVNDYDVINCIHNNFRLFAGYYAHSQSKIHNVFYTGSDYRNNHIHLTDYFNHFVNKSVICLGEFANHGAKNMSYFIGGTELTPHFRKLKYPLVVGHYPSNSEVKGSERICRVMREFKSEKIVFDFDETQLSHDEHIKRLDRCDIYIELFNENLNGKKYGSWGLTAMEAASLGKVVMTMNLSDDVYQKYYGDHKLNLFTDDKSFKDTLNKIISMSLTEIEAMQYNTYNWVNQKHSLMASGYHLKNILNEL